MAELKPCPFCGNSAYTHISYKMHSQKVRYVVKCTKCNANMEYRNEKAAIEAWNKRYKESGELEFDYGAEVE